MEGFPVIERPTPLFDLLKERPTVFIDEPLLKGTKSGKSGKFGKMLQGKMIQGKGFGILDKVKASCR